MYKNPGVQGLAAGRSAEQEHLHCAQDHEPRMIGCNEACLKVHIINIFIYVWLKSVVVLLR